MDRRTFLKGLFVAAVTPSAVRVLYSPKAGLSDKDISELITATLNDLPRGHLQNLFEEHAKAVEEVHKALFRCFKPGIVKTKRIGKDFEGNVYKDGQMIKQTDWPQPPKRR